MPDITGKYTLTEAAREVGVTPSFINRIQRETGIGGRVGTKGKQASFETRDLKIFQRIKVLRTIDFSFQEIKKIWNKELEIYKLLDDMRERYQTDPEASWEETSLILHPLKVKFPSQPFIDASDNPRITVESTSLYNDLICMAEEVKRRRDKFLEDVKTVDQSLKMIIGID
jgi:DNA-binding transcriptional MerR regulator